MSVYLTKKFDIEDSLTAPSDGAKRFLKLTIFFELREDAQYYPGPGGLAAMATLTLLSKNYTILLL